MDYKYLKVSGDFVWGIKNLTKERFVAAVKAGETIIDIEEMKQFDPEQNAWVDIQGDE